MQVDLLTVARYGTNAQKRLFDFAFQYPAQAEFECETIAVFKSVRALLAHCNGAEQRWLATILDRPRPPRYEDSGITDLERIRDDWQQARDETLTIIQGQASIDPERVYAIHLPHWNDFRTTMTLSEMLFHIVNHENYHRGQCSMLFQQQRIDPPNFDYPFLKI